jgi:hypothetical protein
VKKSAFCVVALAILSVACSKTQATDNSAGDTSKSAPAESSSVAAVKHPWGSFNTGSWVKSKMSTVMTIAGRKTTTVVEMKMTLVDKTADKAVVETETTVMGNTTKTKMDMPLNTAAVPAATPAAAPVVNTGSETITVAGKSLNCKTSEFDSEANGNKTHTKTWMSEDVPGFAVKTVTNTSGSMSTETTSEVVDFKAA